MPDQSSHKSALQAPGYSALVYLSVMTGVEVLNASVSATPTYPALNLAITVNSGSAAAVARGMRIVLESSIGAYKGTLVVRSAGTISSANIPTREFGAGMANVVSGDILRVYDDFPLADKLVAADETFAPDQLAYTDQNETPAPVPASGGSWAGWLADASAIPFTGSPSYTLGTGGFVTHAWTTSGGSLSSPTNADITFTPGAAGKYHLTHTVTDTVNSKSRTQHVRARVHDAADPPYEVILTQPPTCDEETGWRCRIRLLASATLSSIPDGAHVILWTPAQTYGCATPGRHHILMDGYLRRDEQNINPVLNTIEFDVISPLAALAELPGFSKVMLTAASPDAWSEFGTGDLSILRAIVQLPLFYTWLIDGAGHDFIFWDFDDALYSAFFLVKNSPLGQMRELAAGRASRVVCHKNGRFEVQPLLAVQPLATRGVLATTYTIDSNDVDAGSDGSDGLVLTREHKRTVETFRMRGFTAGASANEPAFAKWPEAPGMGNQSTTQEKFIVANEAQLFDWCGMLGADADNAFQNGATAFTVSPNLRVPLRGAYWALFDFFHEWIAFADYTASSNLRGTDLTALRWQFKGLALDWDETGLPRTALELKAETAGQPGVDDTPDSSDIPPPETPEEPPIEPPGTGSTGLSLSGDLYVFDATNEVVWLLDRASGVWTAAVDISAIAGTLLGATWRVGGNVARLLTSTHIYRLNQYSSGTPALVDDYTIPETATARVFNFERSEIDWGIVASYIPGTGVRVDWTTNGSSWTRVSVSNNVDTNGSNNPSTGIWIDPHYAGHAILSIFSTGGAMGSGLTGALYQTFDHGATWAALGSSSPGQWLANSIVVGFQDAAAAYKLHGYTALVGADVTFDLYRNDTKVSPVYSGTEYGYVQGYRSLSIADDDAQTIFLIAAAISNSSTVGIWRSLDRGATWGVLTAPSSSVYARQVYAVSRSLAFFCGLNGYVGVWTASDGLIDLTIPGGGTNVALMGA